MSLSAAGGPTGGEGALVVVPRADDTNRWRRLTPPLTTIATLALASGALRVRDPHVSGSWGFCPSAALFGVACPGCGGLRAVHDLTHLDVAAAASSNLLLVAFIPLAVLLLGRRTVDAYRGVARGPSAWASLPVVYAGVALAAGFAVLRNLPAGAWLAP